MKKGGKIAFLVHTKVSAFRCFCDEKWLSKNRQKLEFLRDVRIGIRRHSLSYYKLTLQSLPVGVHMVGNIGRLRASFWWCQLGSTVGGVSQLRLEFLGSLLGPNIASALTAGDGRFSLGAACIASTAVVYFQVRRLSATADVTICNYSISFD
jgi:hypothetical protein